MVDSTDLDPQSASPDDSSYRSCYDDAVDTLIEMANGMRGIPVVSSIMHHWDMSRAGALQTGPRSAQSSIDSLLTLSDAVKLPRHLEDLIAEWKRFTASNKSGSAGKEVLAERRVKHDIDDDDSSRESERLGGIPEAEPEPATIPMHDRIFKRAQPLMQSGNTGSNSDEETWHNGATWDNVSPSTVSSCESEPGSTSYILFPPTPIADASFSVTSATFQSPYTTSGPAGVTKPTVDSPSAISKPTGCDVLDPVAAAEQLRNERFSPIHDIRFTHNDQLHSVLVHKMDDGLHFENQVAYTWDAPRSPERAGPTNIRPTLSGGASAIPQPADNSVA